MSNELPQPRVLLVKLSAIGDIVMASGLPSNIKSSLDAAYIVWLVESPYEAFVSSHPDIDHVIAWPKHEWMTLAKQKQWLCLLRAIRTFRKNLKQHRFDIAIDAQGLLKSACLCWLSGAKRRVGFKSKESSHVFLTESISKPRSHAMSSEYEALGHYIGASHYTLCMPPSSQGAEQATLLCKAEKIGEHYIVLCPFTTRPQKHWPLSHWQSVLTWLNRNSQLPVIILGGPTDTNAASSMAQGKERIFSFAGKLSLSASGALLHHAHCVVGVDTGLTHLAIAHLRPTLALFGSTCPYTQTMNPHATVIFKHRSCAPCRRKPTCDGAFTCMRDITPHSVITWMKAWL